MQNSWWPLVEGGKIKEINYYCSVRQANIFQGNTNTVILSSVTKKKINTL